MKGVEWGTNSQNLRYLNCFVVVVVVVVLINHGFCFRVVCLFCLFVVVF